MNKLIKYLVSLFSRKPAKTARVVPVGRQLVKEVNDMLGIKPIQQPKAVPLSSAALAPHGKNPKKVKVFVRGSNEAALVYKVQRAANGEIANGRVRLRRINHPGTVIEVTAARFLEACRPTLSAAA